MLILLSSIALAGWTKTAEENGCTFFLGEQQGTYAPVRAECDWPIPVEKMQRIVANTEAHADYFSSVVTSRILAPAPGGGNIVYQVHQASGISNREIVLQFSTTPIPGGTRYSWTKAGDQSKLTGEGVPCQVDTGKWEITSSSIGSHVVYELLYDPGGSVPSFLVRWFQGSGTRALVGELRTWAEAH
jgi:hypothetical protein